jgi:tetratricopeptide (TPR) repeat protein
MRSRWIIGGLALFLLVGLAEAEEGAWIRFKAGVDAYQRGEYVTAEKRFQEAVKTDASFGDAHYYLGVLEQRGGKLREAVACFKRVEKKWATYPLARERLGQIAIRLGDKESAEHYFKEVTEIRPGATAWKQLAAVQVDLKKYEEAEASLDKAEKLAPGDLDVVDLRARIRVEQERHAEAAQLYALILEKMPRDAITRYLRARCLLADGKVGEGTDELEKVLEYDPYHEGSIKELLKLYRDDSDKVERTKELQVKLERIRKGPARVRPVSGKSQRR